MSSDLARVMLAVALVLALPSLAACEPNPPPACGDAGASEEPTFSVSRSDPSCGPPPECEECAAVHGDPHLTTHDERHYDLMAVGEFVAARGRNTNVQVRFGPLGDSRVASILHGVAFDLGGTAVSMTLDRPDEGVLRVTVGGEPIDLSDRPWIRGPHRLDLTEEQDIVVRSEGLLAVVGAGASWLDLAIDAGDDDVRGILGSNDDDPDNDFITREGIDLGPDVSFEDLHGAFAESWRIADEESLFDYLPGESTATFTDRSFPDEVVTVDDLPRDERSAAEKACRSVGVVDPVILESCILDLALTGDERFARSALSIQELLGRGDESGRDAVSPEVSADLAWATVLAGLDGGGGRPAISDGRTVFVTGVDDDRNGVLAAVDASTGEELWRLVGADQRCGAGLIDGDRLAVVGQADGPLGVDEAPALVVVDRSSGNVEEAVAWRAAPATYCGEMAAADGTAMVLDRLGQLTGWDLSGSPKEAWTLELPSLAGQLPVVDGAAAAVHRNGEGAMAVSLIDPTTGEQFASTPIRGDRTVAGRHVLAVGDLVVVSLEGDGELGERGGTTTGLRIRDREITRLWEVGSPLGYIDGDGNLLVGYDGSELVGIDVGDGSERWRFDPDGFRNSKSPVHFFDDLVHDLVFGGPFLRRVDRSGLVVEEVLGEELFGASGPAGATWLGPVVDDLLIVQSSDAAGDLLVAAYEPTE